MTLPKVAPRDPGLEAVVDRHLPDLRLLDADLKTALPGIARSPADSARVAGAVQEVRSRHRLIHGDARDLSALADGSVHLVAPPRPIGR